MLVSKETYLVVLFALTCVIVYFLTPPDDNIDQIHPMIQSPTKSIPLEQPLSPPLSSVSAAPEDPIYEEREIECLALNSYFESRNQSLAGQIAVAQVVLNRVRAKNYPDTICEVIQQGPTYENWKGNILPVRNQCHFSWWCDGKSDIPKEKETYESILNLVKKIIKDKPIDITEGSLYYHADYVKPYWVQTLEQTVVIDNHIFYKNIL